ncbi:MAG: hypothetical protein ACKKMW_01540 [Candidatus Nealsonbacteria bacterium]
MKEKIKIPKEIISLYTKVFPLRSIRKTLQPTPAVYCFWWIGNKEFFSKNAERRISLKGPKGRFFELEHKMWFPKELPYIPLYVGKTTKLKDRILKHLLISYSKRVHPKPKNYKKVKPHNTVCQLRAGIEHIFPNEKEPKSLILENIGLSFLDIFGKEAVSERFYLEDFAIGYFRPWFNLDCER